MFAKGARFPREKAADIPGPGFYKLPEVSRLESYKKGAFLEKADRFDSENGTDMPGPEAHNHDARDSSPHPGPSKPAKFDQGLTHLQHQVEALQTQTTRLLKDHQHTVQKYEEKITRNESTIKSLMKDNVALQSQLSTEQKAHRSGCQREVALRAALAKAEASTKGESERANRLAALQRKLQDLEKTQSDGKKQHEAVVVRLKSDLDTSRKACREQNDMVAQLRKQHEAAELRTRELKKATLADQAEIKELRLKVQNSAQVKVQLASSQDEVENLRKSLQNLEAKHQDDLQSQALKLARQEKSLTSEARQKEALERQVINLRSEAVQEATKARDRIRLLQDKLDGLSRSSEESLASAAAERQHFIDTQAALVRVAEAYGDLAAASVPLDLHRQSEFYCASLRLRNIRLERRLADREALVEQLTDYCRQASEERSLLAEQLRELEGEQQTALSRQYVDGIMQIEDTSLMCSLFNVCHGASDWVIYEAHLNDLLVAYAVAHRETMEQGVVTDRLVNHCNALQTDAEALRLSNSAAEGERSRIGVQLSEALGREQVLNEQLAAKQRESDKLGVTLEKERQTGERLARASHQSRMNEERLRVEVDELVDQLADVMRYKEAHAELLAEAVELIQRNELAEAEAERLGKFNAEILGHTNPNQKIFYVDRIRGELADAKHQLLKSTRERDHLVANNAALQHEMAAYKSITVPIEQKARGTRVRIERPPLATRSINELYPSIAFDITPPQEEPIDSSPMTIDEIM
ncbi:hypothetical protein JB92DRAFT_3036967 [Gautieria morchelliformis]|nr:hypothetical protein JB92DRAFT_3036967 [Gautieria morchelliformis]